MRSKSLLYNIVSNLLLQVIIVLYGFIVPKIIINSFGSEVNGLISSITQFLAYITLLESGFGPVVKSALYKPLAKKNYKELANILKTSEKFFRKIAIIFLIYIFILCIFYPFIIGDSFDFLFTSSLIIIIAISTFAEYFFGMTYRLFLQADQKNYIISIIQILTYLLSIVIIILLAKFDVNVHLIKLSSSLVFVFRPVFFNFYIKRKYPIDINNANDNFELKQKWDGLAQHIAAVIHGNTDITILTIFVDLAEVSVYSVYFLVVKGIKSIIQSFSNGVDSFFGDMIAKEEYNNLNHKFNLYEVLYFTIVTIVFSCALILITPFIIVYTNGINDVNYIRPLFGYLLVISEYIWAIRLPYSSISLAAGHFKETRNGAWIEALVNIILSIFFVFKFGIIGVTVGTIVAMIIRSIEFVFHVNKYILRRNVFNSFVKIIIIFIETCVVFIISKYIPYMDYLSYISWGINAFITLFYVSLIVIIINVFVYFNEIRFIYDYFKRRKKNC